MSKAMNPAKVWAEAQAHLAGGRPAAALPLLRRLAAALPRDPAIAFNLGACCFELDRRRDAAAELRRAAQLAPTWPDPLYLLGRLHERMGEEAQAIEALRACLRLASAHAGAQKRLAALLRRAGRVDEAASIYAAMTPRTVEIATALAECLLSSERPLQAIAVAAPFLPGLGPDHALVSLHALSCVQMGRLDEGVAGLKRVAAATPADAAAADAVLMTELYRDDTGAAEIAALHRDWARRFADPLPKLVPSPPPSARLRIGYVSPDFCDHAVAKFFLPVLTDHDRAGFEIFCYGSVAKPDAVTDAIRRQCDHWRDISALDDQAAAARVVADGIHILVDLAGHSSGHRLGLFARRPAPVQMTWLGYPAMTGLSEIDYQICDGVVATEGEEALRPHGERPLRLPHGFHRFSPIDRPAPERGVRDDGVVFCSFNTVSKLSPRTVALWSAVLRRVPEARLLLKRRALADPEVQADLRARFAAHGVAPQRIIFGSRTVIANDHLSQYADADIALDSFPYNGTTTTCEALWMGVPVVTLLGDRYQARVSASLLRQMGLDELVAADEAAFVEIAAALAEDHPRRLALSASLRDRMLASPLGGGTQVVRSLEDALRRAWEERGYSTTSR